MSLLSAVGRVLLDETGEEHHHEDEHHDEHEERDTTRGLRIAAIFIILCAGLLGSLPPLFIPAFKNSSSIVLRLTKAFSAGIILSLALVHIVPESIHYLEELEEKIEYPIAGTTVLFGILALIIIEHTVYTYYADRRSAAASGASTPKNGGLVHLDVHDDAGKQPPSPEKPLKQHEHIHDHHQHGQPSARASSHADHGHSHDCVATHNAGNWALGAGADTSFTGLRQAITAYVMEAGCLVHSILLGIGLGVTVDSRSTVIAILISLAFHQFLEGVSLGAVVGSSNFSRFKGISMMLLYGITTPVGVAIGIGISSNYDPDSFTAATVQGMLNAICGGILLYIALIQLCAEEFSKSDLRGSMKVGLRVAMYAALVLGAALMCVLTIWEHAGGHGHGGEEHGHEDEHHEGDHAE